MFEKVNPSHPDKIADRIAGALVDIAYKKEENPRIAVEVLIGHGVCNIISETSVCISLNEVEMVVGRIAGDIKVCYIEAPQDKHLSNNQKGIIRCGDNGIFKGSKITEEQKRLSAFARDIYSLWQSDGKYILDSGKLIVCQSKADAHELKKNITSKYCDELIINPLGDWSGGINVDTGATNRKLGSDMGDAVTGGGLHGKDLSKADVSLNIYTHLLAQNLGAEIKMSCAIGDKEVSGIPYVAIVETARNYINKVGGFEKFAEWGLI